MEFHVTVKEGSEWSKRFVKIPNEGSTLFFYESELRVRTFELTLKAQENQVFSKLSFESFRKVKKSGSTAKADV